MEPGRELDSNIREALAAEAHEAWAGWMRYLFGKGVFNDDGSWTMPAWAVERWRRQMITVYADLPESEKESDRKEADRYLVTMRKTSVKKLDTTHRIIGLLRNPYGLDDHELRQVRLAAADEIEKWQTAYENTLKAVE